MRNLLADAVRARNVRLYADLRATPSAAELVTITAADVQSAADAASLPQA